MNEYADFALVLQLVIIIIIGMTITIWHSHH